MLVDRYRVIIMNTSKKTVLLVVPFFYEYHVSIKKQLQKMNYNVILVDDNITSESRVRYLHSKLPLYNHKKEALHYYKRILTRINNGIDILFAVKGDSLTKEVMKYITNKYPKIKTVIYFWDGVNKYPSQIQTARLFKTVFTYDFVDSQNLGWLYRPLFFDSKDSSKEKSKTIDLSFVGSLHSKRGQLVNHLYNFSKTNYLNAYIYLFCRPTSFFYQKYFKRDLDFNINKKLVHFNSISKEETEDIYERSACVVDYQSGDQSGLTIRTIECLAHRCKIITNNTSIIKSDFYHPNNVYIYREDKEFSIPIDFIKSEYSEVPRDIVYKYSIESFVKDIIGGLS